MPFMAKQGNNYEEVETLVDTEGREIDYVLSKVGNTYKRTFTKIRELEDAPPLNFKSIKPQANLLDYRIYGQTSRNLFDEKYEGIDDEYDLSQTVIYKSINVGAGMFTLSSNAPRTSENYANLFFASGIVDSGVTTLINGVSVGNPKTFTSIDGYITIGYRNYNGVNPKLYQTQLERGNTATDYEPYGESVGDRTGNLFDENHQMTTGVINSDGTIDTSITYAEYSDYIPIHTEMSYYFSCEYTTAKNARIAFYNSSKQFIDHMVGGGTNPTITFNRGTLSDVSFIRICLDIGWQKCMLNSGSTPLPYEPYGYKVPVTVEGKNLLNFPHWANNVYVVRGTKIINGNSIAITSTAATCFTGWNTTEYPLDSKIPVAEGEHITFTWDTDANDASSVWIFPNATSGASVHTASANKKLEYTVPAGVSFITFRLDVSTANKTITYSNLMITKEDATTYEPYQPPVTTNLYLPEQIRKVGSDAEYIDYGEQKQHRVRKNYLQSSDFEAGAIYTGQAYTGYTYQNSKTEAGLSNFHSTRKRSTNLITIIGTYTISIADGWEFTIVMFPDNKNSGEQITYNTEPVTISNCTFAIQFRKTDISDISSTDISDYKIMLNKGSAALPYEPYIENTDLDVTLPALPTVAGTNVLSVGTEVQPSEMYIKGNIKGGGAA